MRPPNNNTSPLVPPSLSPIYNNPPPPYHTILDLRAQISANASTLLSCHSAHASPDRLEIVVARFIPRATQPPQYRYYAMLVQRPLLASEVQDGRAALGAGKAGLEVLVKGKPLESEVAALEWLLGDTEDRIHALVKEEKTKTAEEGCAVM